MKEGEYKNGGCSFQDKPRIQDKRFAINAAKKTRNGIFSIRSRSGPNENKISYGHWDKGRVVMIGN
jgi:hypothetical protein